MRRVSFKFAACLLVAMMVSVMLVICWNPVVSGTATVRAWVWDDSASAVLTIEARGPHHVLCSDEGMTVDVSPRNDSSSNATPSTARMQQRVQPPPLRSVPSFREQLELFSWRPGGVRGPSLSEVEASLHSLYDRIKERNMDVLMQLGPCTFPGTVTSVAHRGLFMLERYIVDMSLELKMLDEGHAGDDCRYRLPPHQRAMCLAMAAVGGKAPPTPPPSSHSNVSFRNGTPPMTPLLLHQLPHYRNTNCRALTPCVDWTRGRFTTTLSTRLLRHVYRNIVQPRLRASEGGLVISWFAKQLIHDEENTAEWPWLLRRSKAMELDLEKRRSLYYFRAPPPPPNPRRRFASASHIPVNLPAMWSNASWHESPTDMTSLLQGASFPPHAPPSVSAGAPSLPLLPLLTQLELLATLWAMVGPSTLRDVVNVMVFNGDSVNRELFHRLIHYVRHGDEDHRRVAAGEEESTIPLPHVHFATHYDMVYVVHREYDELLGFHSPQTNGSSTYTVERYFRAVRRNVTEWMRQHGEGAEGDDWESNPAALLYIVWLWDPFTSASRGIMSTAPTLLSQTLATDIVDPPAAVKNSDGTECRAISSASTQPPLVSYRVRPSLVVQGTGFWERQQGQHVMDMLTASALQLGGGHDEHSSPGSQQLHPRRIVVLTAPSEELLQDLSDAVPPYSPRRWQGGGTWEGDLSRKLLDPQDRVSNITTHYNLIKNQHFFAWIANLTALRRGNKSSLPFSRNEAIPDATASERQRLPTTSTSVHLLDKAKVQFFDQHTLRDKIHFTCRAAFAFAKPRFFEASMAQWTLERLLLPVRQHINHPSKAGVPHVTSLLTTNTPLRQDDSWCSAAAPMSARHLGRFWFKLLLPSRLRFELWSRLGLESSRIRGPIVTGVLLPRGVIHPELAQELEGGHVPQVQLEVGPAPQVYVNVDSPRLDCSNDGDNILLHTLAQFAARHDDVRGPTP
jgi:hypothetical protein